MRRTVSASVLVLLGVFAMAAPAIAEKDKTDSKPSDKKKAASNESALVWRDPGDVSTLDLLYGHGGQQDAPDPKGVYTFISEDHSGSSPKFDVQDQNGVRWRVKMGEEPQSETAADHLMWAAGFFVDEDYFLPQITVKNLPKLSRGNNWVSPDGVVRRVRLKRHVKEVKDLGTWNWFHNGCGPENEFNALRAMMAVINNWDLKVVNNKLVEVDGQRWCIVSDLGAAFGKTGNFAERSKGVPKDFASAPFIDTVAPQTVDFVMHTRQTLPNVVQFRGYEERARMENITKGIPRSDAQWLGNRLGMLSADHLRDCFRSAGYKPEEVEVYVQAMQKRIAALKNLGAEPTTAKGGDPSEIDH